MATMTVTISGLTNNDIEYSPTDKIIKPDDTVTFNLDLGGYVVSITWDSGCPMTSSSPIDLQETLCPSVNRTVSGSATNGQYNFTVTFEHLNRPHPRIIEEPEEGPSHGGLEVSRDN